MVTKDFAQWHAVKRRINSRLTVLPYKEREIWWCSVGVNVGREADGKGPNAVRPVLVVRKFNVDTFLGLPLTSQKKDNTRFFHPFFFHGRNQYAMLSQLRLWEGRRLQNKMGQLSEGKFNDVKDALKKLVGF